MMSSMVKAGETVGFVKQTPDRIMDRMKKRQVLAT
jgi:hypothetical protein